MKKILFLVAAMATLMASAQIRDDKNLFNHLSVGAGIGTNGISVEVGTTVLPFITVRAGVDILPKISYSDKLSIDQPNDWNSLAPIVKNAYLPSNNWDVQLEGSMKSVSGKILFDIYTGKNSLFHFTVGAQFGGRELINVKARGEALAALETYNRDVENGIPGVGTEKFLAEGYELGVDKGRANIVAKTGGFRPYIGIGVGRSVPRKRVGCKFEAGAMFWGKPTLYDKYKDCEITKESFKEKSDVRDALDVIDKVSVYPTLKLTIFGRIF